MRRLFFREETDYETMEPMVSGIRNSPIVLRYPYFVGLAAVFRQPEFCTVFRDDSGQFGILRNSGGCLFPDWVILGEEKKG